MYANDCHNNLLHCTLDSKFYGRGTQTGYHTAFVLGILLRFYITAWFLLFAIVLKIGMCCPLPFHTKWKTLQARVGDLILRYLEGFRK